MLVIPKKSIHYEQIHHIAVGDVDNGRIAAIDRSNANDYEIYNKDHEFDHLCADQRIMQRTAGTRSETQ